MGGRTGLDYGGCRLAIEPHRASLGKSFRELLPDLQILEHAMLAGEREVMERDRARREAERK